MAQESRKAQQETVVRQPLTPEEARRIAKQSHARLIAQRAQTITKSGVMPAQATVPQSTEKKEEITDKKAKDNQIQVQVVKRTANQITPRGLHKAVPRNEQPSVTRQPPLPSHSEHITKEGTPDRRFIENRALPPMQARDIVGVHRTKNGAPDRRYLENQHLSAQQAEIEKAKHVLKTLGESLKE